MVHIQPFKGLRYNPHLIQMLDDVTAPPYDVISPKEQQDLHDKHPYNIVRLILGLKRDADNDSDNVYTRAHLTLEEWRQNGIMQPDGQPAFYGYSQEYQGVERSGFIGLIQIESFESGQVLPHEYTLGGPKADRLALTKATGCILSPIFCLYDDPGFAVEPLSFRHWDDTLEVQDKDGVTHRLWLIQDPKQIQELQALLDSRSVLIADGHHRYETAMNYRNWWRQEHGLTDVPYGQLPCDYTMAFMTNMSEPGLKIYPTHRVFTHLPANWSADKLDEGLKACFEPTDDPHALFWVQRANGPKTPYRLKPAADLSAIPEVLRQLDAALLDQLVFQQMLGSAANTLKQDGYLHFIRDEDEVRHILQTDNQSVVFWLHAPSVEMVRDVCTSGYRMPQKSTYFYPKLLSGLVIYNVGLTPAQTGNPLAANSTTP